MKIRVELDVHERDGFKPKEKEQDKLVVTNHHTRKDWCTILMGGVVVTVKRADLQKAAQAVGKW